MSKEYLEALERIKNKFINFFHEDNPDVECIEDALLELKAIKEAKPSKVLDLFNHWKINTENGVVYIPEFVVDKLEQSLIKSQEQEKTLNIIKKKKVDTRILRNCLKDETPEHYNFLNDKHQLTQEEFDLLKEMLI